MAEIPPLTLEAMYEAIRALGPVTVQALDASYTADEFLQFLADVSGAELGDPTDIDADVTFTNGVFNVANPFTLLNVNNGDTVSALLYYVDTGSAATSVVLQYDNKNADDSDMAYLADGAPITVAPPSGNIGQI